MLINVTLAIHCKPCMAKTEMKKSLMVRQEQVLFDDDDICIYECPSCKHLIEIKYQIDHQGG